MLLVAILQSKKDGLKAVSMLQAIIEVESSTTNGKPITPMATNVLGYILKGKAPLEVSNWEELLDLIHRT